MNMSLQNLKNEAKLLNIMPFHQITSRAKKGTVVQFKTKTKQELYNEIKKVDPKIRKKLFLRLKEFLRKAEYSPRLTFVGCLF